MRTLLRMSSDWRAGRDRAEPHAASACGDVPLFSAVVVTALAAAMAVGGASGRLG